MKTNLKVLVIGCEKKSSNFGVQMLAHGTEKLILDLFPSAQVTYFEEYLETRNREARFTRSLKKYTAAFFLAKEHDLVFIVNGGDSFTDQYGMRRFFSVYLYFLSVKCSKTFSVLGPQTIGPFNKLISRKLSRISWIYPNMNFVRDQKSFDYLELVGLNHLERTVDVAFYFESQDPSSVDKEFDYCLNVSGLLWKPNDLVDSSAYQEMISKIIEFILRENKRLVITPHVIGDNENDSDLEAIKDLKKRYPKGIDFLEPKSPFDVSVCLKKSRKAIGSRLHFCINALRNNVEVIALSYSPKFQGTLLDYSKATVFEISDLNENLEVIMLKLVSLNETLNSEIETTGYAEKQGAYRASLHSSIFSNFEWHQNQIK